MKNINELLEEIQRSVDDMYDYPARVEVMREVKILVANLNGLHSKGAKQFKFYNASELTRIGGVLAISQYNLIEYENEAFKNFKRTKSLIAVREASIRKTVSEELNKKADKKISVKDITAETEARLVRYEIESAYHEAEYERVKAMKFSINSILHRIDTRIKYLMSDNNVPLNNETEK